MNAANANAFTVRKVNSPDWRPLNPRTHVCVESARLRCEEVAAFGPEMAVYTSNAAGTALELVGSYSTRDGWSRS